MTTIVQPVQQMAQQSVEILISCIEDSGSARHEIVPFVLLQRESSQKL